MRIFERNKPIISSLLENDVYKFMMMNFILRYYRNLPVTFSFLNRTKDVPLAKYVDETELKEQLAHVATLRMRRGELEDLADWKLFRPFYLGALRDLTLTVPEVKRVGDTFDIRASGMWFDVTLWETIVLPIVSELYVRGYAKAHGITDEALFAEAWKRAKEKAAFFKNYPGLRAAQFGLRRRASGFIEKFVTRLFMSECPGLITGVSNVHLARELEVEAQGTNAHELPMAVYATSLYTTNREARRSVYKVLEQWQMIYGLNALIMLPDTFGTDPFLAQLPEDFLLDWRGFRQDSGDPIAFGEKVIAKYRSVGIDPTEKLVIFSDGLTPEKMVELYEHFSGRINVAFGVGTNWTNDLGLVKPPSLVMKITEAAGRPTVKLSDNLNKATGTLKEIERAKYIFGYTNTFKEAVVY